MIKLHIKETMKQMGRKPTSYALRIFGISHTTAQNMMNGKAKAIKLKSLFDICHFLQCTPNDLFDIPDKDFEGLPQGHPLRTIKKPKYNPSPLELIQTMSPDKIKEANELLRKLKEE